MLYLDKSRLEMILGARGISINKLAEQCGISRQSIYNMYDQTPVFNTTFEKIREFLNIDYRAITSDKTVAFELLRKAPEKIKIGAYRLFEYARKNICDLLIYGSGSAGKYGMKSEWNFALYFPKNEKGKDLGSFRQRLQDEVSPYAINLIHLNESPLWLKLLIKDQYVRLLGKTEEDMLFRD